MSRRLVATVDRTGLAQAFGPAASSSV